jgi:hypothetical protein
MQAAARLITVHAGTQRRSPGIFSGLPAQNLCLRPAIFQPSGTPLATLLERGAPERLPWGGLMLMSGEKALGQQARPAT